VPSLLVRGGTVLTQDAARRVIRGDVYAEDGLVRSVGEGCPQDADVVVDAEGGLVLPGLVNLHTHSPMTLLRGLADDLPLERWLSERVWPVEAQLTEADVEAGAALAVAEMLASGTTSFNDMYFFPAAAARVASAAGIRAWIATPFLDFPTPETQPDRMPDLARVFTRRWRGHALVTPTLAPHAVYTCSDATLAEVAALRTELAAQVHTHCSETRTEVYEVEAARAARPVAVLERHGLLAGSVLAHCGWVTKDEVRRIATEGAAVAHCPTSNMKLATGGWLPLPELWEAGGVAGLGTDGAASNNTLDVFQEMKLAALVHKAHRWDASVAPAQRVLDMGTRDGARALHRDDLGSIEAGKRADLVVVDATRPHLAPLHVPASQVVYAARAGDVAQTIVDGRVLYDRGRYATLDIEKVVERAREAAARVAKAVPR